MSRVAARRTVSYEQLFRLLEMGQSRVAKRLPLGVANGDIFASSDVDHRNYFRSTASSGPDIPLTPSESSLEQRATFMRTNSAFDRPTRWIGGARQATTSSSEAPLSNRRTFGKPPKRSMATGLITRGLRVRILTGFTLVILLTVLIAAWSYYHISTLGTASEHLFKENYRSIQYAHTMELVLLRFEESADATDRPTRSRSLDAQFQSALHEEFNNITEPGELDVAKQIEKDYDALLALYLQNPGREIGEVSGRAAIRAATETVRTDCETLLRINERAMFDRSEALKERANYARLSTIGITLLLVGVAMFLAVAVSRRSLAEFQELDRAKSNFLATAAHELKTPLSSIKTSSGLLVDGIVGPLTPAQKESASIIRRESDRLLALTRELLDLARLEAGTLELSRVPTEPATLLETAILPVTLQADTADVEIDAIAADNLPRVTVDPNKIAWAITNLLSNAIRYSPHGGLIRLSANVTDGELWIAVTDQGKGIAEADLTRIFEKFVQVEEGSMGGGSGSGLGLSIAREIVLAHGGRIWATSEPGKGSTFTIALPIGEQDYKEKKATWKTFFT